jgi:hypothetical protein
MSPVGLRGSVLESKVSFILADPAFIDQANALFGGLGLTVMAFYPRRWARACSWSRWKTGTGRRF